MNSTIVTNARIYAISGPSATISPTHIHTFLIQIQLETNRYLGIDSHIHIFKNTLYIHKHIIAILLFFIFMFGDSNHDRRRRWSLLLYTFIDNNILSYIYNIGNSRFPFFILTNPTPDTMMLSMRKNKM